MSKAIRNIIYELTYNPILEYWELIKYKPIFQKVESLKKELNSIKKDKNNFRNIIYIFFSIKFITFFSIFIFLKCFS